MIPAQLWQWPTCLCPTLATIHAKYERDYYHAHNEDDVDDGNDDDGDVDNDYDDDGDDNGDDGDDDGDDDDVDPDPLCLWRVSLSWDNKHCSGLL